jgi:hypothetical protein
VRSLVLADVHADLEALDRVLADAAGGWDRLLLLGDLVGYGHAPAEVVDRLRALEPAAAVRGNHEAMLAALRAGRRPRAVAPITPEAGDDEDGALLDPGSVAAARDGGSGAAETSARVRATDRIDRAATAARDRRHAVQTPIDKATLRHAPFVAALVLALGVALAQAPSKDAAQRSGTEPVEALVSLGPDAGYSYPGVRTAAVRASILSGALKVAVRAGFGPIDGAYGSAKLRAYPPCPGTPVSPWLGSAAGI